MNVNYEFEGINITGVVGKPEIARSNRANQIFFVNKRYIRDRILSNAAEKAFKGMIPIGKFGFLVLNIEMEPSLVDVNVHPAKLEVRFQEEQKVFKSVYCGIQDTLLKAELIANSETQITGKLEKDKIEGETMENEEETKSSISGLFRRIAKNANNNEEMTLVESIYNSKNAKAVEEKKEEPLVEKFNSEPKPLEIPQIDIGKSELLDEIKAKSESIRASLFSKPQNAETSQTETPKVNVENVENKDEIKETINEFMQMGSNLTAEQIREKIAKIASNNSQKVAEQASEEKTNTHINIEPETTPMLGETPKPEALNSPAETPLFTLTKPTELLGTYGESFESIESEENRGNLIEEIYASRNNLVSEDEEKYETKTINTNEIDKLSNQSSNENEETKTIETFGTLGISEESKPGDILLSILQENSRKGLTTEEVLPEQFDDMYAQIFGGSSKDKEKEQTEEEKTNANDIVDSNMSIFDETEEGEILPYKLVGIAFKTYIILEIEQELYILDQHAAHERIMYEKVKANYYSDEDKDSQLMLLPDVITLTHKEMDIARDNMDKFEKAGFVLEEFGENTIKLTGVPNICLDLDTKELFLETLDEINTVARTAKQEIEEKFIATIACKAAVKANMALTTEEVEALLEKLLALPNPFTCPHGRPTAIKLSKTDIEKKFARRK